MNKASILTSNESDTCPILSNDDDDDDDDDNNNNEAYIKFNNCAMQRSGKLHSPTPDHISRSEYPADTIIAML